MVVDTIPETGIRDIGTTFGPIRAGLRYGLARKKAFPSARHLFDHGLQPHDVPKGFDTVMIRPLAKHIEPMREFLRSAGLRLSIKTPNPEADSFFMRARYIWNEGNFESLVTCESVVIGFPEESYLHMLKFKMLFSRSYDFMPN